MRRGQRGEFVDEAGFVALAHPIQQVHVHRHAGLRGGLQQRTHRRDAGAGGQQHERGRRGRQQHVAEGRGQRDHRAQGRIVRQEAAHQPTLDRLDGDRQPAVGLHRGAVATQQPAAVDLHAQAHVLAGLQAAPVAVGLQHQGHRVPAGRGALDQPRHRLFQRPQRVEPGCPEIEQLRRHQSARQACRQRGLGLTRRCQVHGPHYTHACTPVYTLVYCQRGYDSGPRPAAAP